jgi:hypothetical protein
MTLIIQKPTGAKLNLAKDYVEGDRNYSNVSLLLHGDGTNGSTTIIDNSPTPKTVTAFGNAQISTAQSKFGGSSLFISGPNNYLRLPLTSDLDLETLNYTVETFIYSTSFAGNPNIISSRTSTSGLTFRLNESGVLNYFQGPGLNNLVASQNCSLNIWQHVALTRQAGTVTLWLNGLSVGSVISNASLTSGRAMAIGVSTVNEPGFGSETFFGYIDDFRITKGVARYTANFTPPTAAFADAQF